MFIFIIIWIFIGVIAGWVVREALIEGVTDYEDQFSNATISKLTWLAFFGGPLTFLFIVFTILKES